MCLITCHSYRNRFAKKGEASSPAALFQTHRRQPISAQGVFSYDVSTDGQRFLIITKVDQANAAPLSVLLNWASQMEK